jgi:hypothetical protein
MSERYSLYDVAIMTSAKSGRTTAQQPSHKRIKQIQKSSSITIEEDESISFRVVVVVVVAAISVYVVRRTHST